MTEASTRRRLLEAASEVFAERGYEGTRVQEIAARAGLTTGAIYNQFRNKDDLLLTAIARAVQGLIDDLASTRGPERRPGTVLEHLLAGLRHHEGHAARALLMETVTAARRSPTVKAGFVAGLEGDGAVVRHLIDEMVADGAIRPDVDLEAATHLLNCVAYGYYALEGAGVRPPNADAWSEICRQLVTRTLGPTEELSGDSTHR